MRWRLLERRSTPQVERASRVSGLGAHAVLASESRARERSRDPGRAPGREATRAGGDDARAQARARRQQMRVLATLMRSGETVWDVGARHGLVTVLAAKRVGAAGVVHAFEPSARSRWFLEHHVAWSGVENVVVHQVALGTFDGETWRRARLGGRARGGHRPLTRHASRDSVPVRTARALVESGAAPQPTFLRIDAPGAEADVLHGSLPTLSSATRMLVAVHSRAAFDACTEVLGRYDYRAIESRELQASLDDAWCGAPVLVCFGPAHDGWRRDLVKLGMVGY